MTTTTPKLTLLNDLFKDPRRHTKDASARTKAGQPCLPNDPNAVCWCLSGGALRVGLDPEDWGALKESVAHSYDLPIAIFNDRPTTSVDHIIEVINDAKILRAGGTIPKRGTPWPIVLISLAIVGTAAALVWMLT